MRKLYIVSGAFLFILAVSMILVRPTVGESTPGQSGQRWHYATLSLMPKSVSFAYGDKSWSETDDPDNDGMTKLARDLGMANHFSADIPPQTTMLNLIGRWGWELVSIQSSQDGSQDFYFKQPAN